MSESAAFSRRPNADEYAPFYSGYVSHVPDGDIRDVLATTGTQLVSYFRQWPDELADYRYAPEKWSVKQVIQHLIDAERVFIYRALRFARNDESPLAGFDENAYADLARVDHRTLADLADEFEAIRQGSVLFARSLSEDELDRAGTASGKSMSVRGVLYVTAGHPLHHGNILESRYRQA